MTQSEIESIIANRKPDVTYAPPGRGWEFRAWNYQGVIIMATFKREKD